MINPYAALVISLAVAISPSATATDMPHGLKKCGAGTVSDILSGDRIILDQKQTVTLADVKAPEYWPSDSAYKSWPYGVKAKKKLRDIAFAKEVTLWCYSKRKNHRGDAVAHIQMANKGWLQHHMLSHGQAFFMPHFTRPADAQALRAAEAKARQHKKGLWALTNYLPVDATSKKVRPGWFQIVSGQVLSAKKISDRFFLNFGRDWSKDFTVEVPKRLFRQFAPQGPSHLISKLSKLEGQHTEVRGWVEWSGGPKIILEDMEQLYIIDKNRAENDPDIKTRPPGQQSPDHQQDE